VRLAQPILAKADEIGATFFEITTVMAFQYFAENKVDFAVIECGMGGRYDSTNIITPMISCITAIADDHKDYLGDTIEKIAYEKAGIIKNNIPVVIAHNEDNIIEVIKAEAEKNESALNIVDDIIKNSSYTLDRKTLKAKHSFDYKEDTWKLSIPFIGVHQSYNLASTVVLCSEIGNLLSIEPNKMKDYAIAGFENVMQNFPMHGRTEIHNTEPILAVDGGHNPAAAKMLANSFKGVVEDFTIIFAAMHDKDSKAMLNELKAIANNFIFPQLENSRSEKNSELCKYAEDLGISNYELADTAQAAYDMASKKNAPLLITGSFYLIGEIELREWSKVSNILAVAGSVR
jgi:dihydrofolate synthase/folylpolyglutamate synthase